MWLGIDFGTTNSAISFSDGKRVHTFRVDEHEPDLLPSLIYITKHYEESVGTTARNIYLEKNTNRRSQYKPVEVGVIRLDVGDSGGFKQIDQVVTVLVDVLSPGRLMRSIKTGLRTIEYDGSIIFGERYAVERLIAILLKRMVAVAEPNIGEPVKRVVMGRPVKFSDDPAVDKRAEERIVAAAKLAGVEEVTFLPEPIAAAYAYHRDFDQPTNTLIFDFGGGTLDLTVAVLGGDKPEILATEGVLIGGDDFDRRLIEHLLPYFGRGAKLILQRPDGSRYERPIPEHVWGSVLDWQTVEEMKRSDAIKMIEDAAVAGNSTDPDGMQALYELIVHNLYYKLLQAVERVKIELSSAETAHLSFHERSIHIDETITRQQFDKLIHMEIWRISNAIDRVVAESGLSHADIEFVVNTGGSSQIPVFRQLLADKFDAAQSATRAERNLTGVVQGLGIYGADLDAAEDDLSELLRTRILSAVKANPIVVFEDESAETEEFSHAVVGINADGDVNIVPWLSGKPLPTAKPVHLTTGVFTSKIGRVVLGTTLSRFIVPQLDDLNALMKPNALVPFYLKLEREKAEEYIFVTKWDVSNAPPLMILVTRWGNVRLFYRRLIEKPLRDEGLWKLDMRGKPDPPSMLVGAKRTSQIFLLTQSGKATRVPVANISVRGSKGLRLQSAETVHAVAVDKTKQLIAITANGLGERFYVNEIPVAPKTGSTGYQLFRKMNIRGLLPSTDADTAHALTSKGRRITLDLTDVKRYGGHHQLTQLNPQEQIVKCWL